MTMHLRVMFIVQILLCLFICSCNGAPPGGHKSRQPRAKYTDEEDSFIIEELSNRLDGSTLAFKREVWGKIADKHKEKRKANTEGFSKERTSESLGSRFRKVLIHNYPQNNLKVPETLLRKIFRAHSRKLEQGGCDPHRYTKEENEFIIEELRKISSGNTLVISASTVEEIRKAHDKKRLANTVGFEHERNLHNLRRHMFRMKKSGQLPNNIVQQVQMPQKDTTAASSSTSAAQNQQTDVEDTAEEPDDEEEDEIFGDIMKDPLFDLGNML